MRSACLPQILPGGALAGESGIDQNQRCDLPATLHDQSKNDPCNLRAGSRNFATARWSGATDAAFFHGDANNPTKQRLSNETAFLVIRRDCGQRASVSTDEMSSFSLCKCRRPTHFFKQ